jgi:hypothetical protein
MMKKVTTRTVTKEKIRKHLPFLNFLRTLDKKQQKQIVMTGDIDLIKVLSGIALNLLKGNVHLTKAQIKKLKPYRKDLVYLGRKTPSIRQRKLKIQKGGFLGAVLGLLPSVISAIVAATT